MEDQGALNATGQTFGPYQIQSKLGQGGMGAVYLAHDTSLERFVALKVLPGKLAADAEYVARFRREAIAAAQLDHPNIVRVFAAGESDGTHYIAMELVEGQTLHGYLAQWGPMQPVEALGACMAVAKALDYAWNRSRIIHRDVKPANIFISSEGEVKLGDLGLVKRIGGESTELTQSGVTVGTPHYCSPEQARGEKDMDFRSDIYSLGCTLYHLLSGHMPYENAGELSPVAIMVKHVTDPPPVILQVLPACPSPVVALLDKMLAKQPAARHQSYGELIQDLQRIITQLQSGVVTPVTGAATVAAPRTTETAAASRKLPPTLIYTVAGVAAAAILAGVFLWAPWKQSRTGVPPVQSATTGQAGRPSYSEVAAPEVALKQLGNVFTNSVGAEMVYIPPGEFLMGSTKEEQEWALANGTTEERVKYEGKAPRKTTIKQGLWMGRTEVTVGQWKQFIAATGYRTDAEQNGYVEAAFRKGSSLGRVEGASWRDPNFGSPPQDNHPVCCVSWRDAVAFCDWLHEQERKAGRLPAGYRVRLPTEKEWEYACRAGTQTKFWWGDTEDGGTDRLNRVGTADGFMHLSPVDRYGDRGRNNFGLADMLGNVREWCLDMFDPDVDHQGDDSVKLYARVVRGGSFSHNAAGIRCASRDPDAWKGSNCNNGFRVCCGVESPIAPAMATTPQAAPPVPTPSATPPPPASKIPALPAGAAEAALKQLGNVFTNAVGAEMVYIPPGEFMMGSTPEEREWVKQGKGRIAEHLLKREGAQPRTVRIRQGFWMGRTEVTVGQWKAFANATGYLTDGEKRGESYVFGVMQNNMLPLLKGANWRNPNFGPLPQDNDPVCCISWNDAKAFCEWLNGCELAKRSLPTGYKIRLPTEAEWEYACRAGTKTKFWWGESWEDGMGRLNWIGQEDRFEFVSPVDHYGARGRNKFGLADMLGNVSEWVLDGYDPRQAQEEFVTADTETRIHRGGSCLAGPGNARCAGCVGAPRFQSTCTLGFRFAVGVEPSVATAKAETPETAPPAPTPSATQPSPAGKMPALPAGAAAAALKQLGNVFTNSVGAEMVYIPPGEFMLGSTKEEQEWAKAVKGRKPGMAESEGEYPRKAAIRHGFWMGRTEVTVGQWKQFVNATGYVTKAEKKGGTMTLDRVTKAWAVKNGVSWRDPGFGIAVKDDHPVCCMSWEDAVAYCAWLNECELKSGRLPTGFKVRLPTEAEWEYACRAGTQTEFWWGDSTEDGEGRCNRLGRADGFEYVSPVDYYGARGRNNFGLADMLGNVAEPCLDGFDPTRPHEEFFTGNTNICVLRGGSSYAGSTITRCASRDSAILSNPNVIIGFRVCYGVDVSGATTAAVSTSPAAVANETGILAPPETRVAALTTNPKVGEVFTLNLGSNVTMELMGIPPGEFMLGGTVEEQEWAKANGATEEQVKSEGKASRKTTIRQGFWMGRTEVTVGQWKQFVKETRYVTDGEKNGESHVPQGPGKPYAPMKGKSWRDPNFGFEPQDGHPVCCISWNDAIAFCEWLGERERKAGRLPAGFEVRLPTEAEWEYACRASSQSKFWWGEAIEDGKGRLNWSGKDDGFEIVAPVDSYGARGRNSFGLADMLGNVTEWCLDEYDSRQAHENCNRSNPGGRALRGGSFGSGPAGCRCAARFGNPPASSKSHFGFRVCVGVNLSGVRTLTPPTSATVAEDPFLKEVAGLPADQQLARVMAKLKELNPQFDSREQHKIEGGQVTELSFSTVAVKDISPLRALRSLKKLTLLPWVAGGARPLGALSDLSPLQGLPLTFLACGNTQVSDLAPLKNMPLTILSVDGTQAANLSPLEGMPLTILWCDKAKVTDLSPLARVPGPLKELRCDFVPERDAAVLRGIKTLEKINNMPAATFWMRTEMTMPASPKTPIVTGSVKAPAQGSAEVLIVNVDKDFTFVARGFPKGLSAGQTEAPPLKRKPYEPLKLPQFKSPKPLYGYLKLGNGPTSKVNFALEGVKSASPLYLDVNNNKDLTDDGPPLPDEGTGGRGWQASLEVEVFRSDGSRLKRSLRLWLWVRDRNDQPYVLFSPRCYLEGKLTVDGRQYDAVAFERTNCNGLYKASGLWIDLNGDGTFDTKLEHFNDQDVLTVNGKQYRLRLDYP
ncbi:MAG: SUMF1/EgtB/PvdO family nonheme iron enzyme [Verrucomicrobia bacterium]|nr:SUMF1/EgtB/PvdO family nonheme iron enzyme [Verrucomicrobiota bacterium]